MLHDAMRGKNEQHVMQTHVMQIDRDRKTQRRKEGQREKERDRERDQIAPAQYILYSD